MLMLKIIFKNKNIYYFEVKKKNIKNSNFVKSVFKI